MPAQVPSVSCPPPGSCTHGQLTAEDRVAEEGRSLGASASSGVCLPPLGQSRGPTGRTGVRREVGCSGRWV